MKKEYLYIFVHLHKTGGTTLNKHLSKNFKKEEILFLYYDKLGLDPFTSKKQDYSELAEKAIKKLSKSERNKIKVITGHFLPNGIHKHFPNKTSRYITIVRDPHKRARSMYNYFRTLHSKEKSSGKNKKIYRSFLKIKGTVPDFSTWLEKKYGNPKGSIVPRPMDMYFSDLGYKLSDFYFIGITEKLGEDLLWLYKLFGIKKFFVNQNLSRSFVKDDSSKEFFEKKYKKSYEIYENAVKLNKQQGRIRQCRQAGMLWWKIWVTILTPFTQVIFDFTESLRMFSSYLRKKSKIYNQIMDWSKQQWHTCHRVCRQVRNKLYSTKNGLF